MPAIVRFGPMFCVSLLLLILTLSPTSAQTFVDEINAGVELARTSKDQQALVHFRKALAMMPADNEYRGVTLNYIGQALNSLGQYEAAEQALKQSLPLVAKFQGPNTQYQVAALSCLGNIQLRQKRYPQGVTYFNQALAIMKTMAAPDPVFLGQAHNGIGHAFGAMGKQAEALAAFEKALSVQEKAGQTNTVLIGNILSNLGLTHAKNGDFDQSVTYYRRAWKVYETAYGPDHPETRTMRDAVEMAEGSIRRRNAVAIGQPVAGSPVQMSGAPQGPDPNSVAGIYSTALAALHEERWPEAESLFRQLLDKVDGLKFNPEFMGALKASLAHTLYSQQKYDEAATAFEEALALFGQADSPDEGAMKAVVVLSAYNYYAKNDYVHAEKALRGALASLPDDDDHVAELTEKLASSLYYQGKFEEAKPLYEKALSAFIIRLGPQDLHARSIRVKLEELEKLEAFRATGQDHYLFSSLGELERWNDDKTEIIVHILSGEGMEGWSDAYMAQAREAFLQWQHALNDRVRFVFTGTPEKTDIELGWADGPLESSDVSSKMGVNETRSTNYFFTHKNIIVSLQDERGSRGSNAILGTLLHEIGHALGLRHSSDPTDIMATYGDFKWSTEAVPSLTERDIRTIQLLYQMKPRITNPQNITVSEYRAFLADVEEAREAFNRSYYKKAYKLYQEARAKYPDDPYTNYFCAISAYEEEEYEEAIALLEQVRFPPHEDRFSINKYLGYTYVELGHKYNKWGKRNKELSREYYRQGVKYLEKALINPSLDHNQKRAIADKISEGVQRRRPMEQDPYYQIPIWIRM